jgi:translation initiation factor 1
MSSPKTKDSNLVYSTEHGRICPNCRKPVSACDCRRKKPAAKEATPKDGIVRVSRETKGRKGKGVTLITGVPLPADELKAFCKLLKKKCGTGGTVKNGVIEIQGDHRDILMILLQERGWVVKRSGG